ncbi:nucleotide sugar dehydrogenase [Marinobacter sp. LV10R520-4]|uniref:nucleotide sugar dehydrogenase n=1 Tax=Marinobacter sp. LV10R520-4 TaxID=1761796 RepID=UPI000BF4224C|nr:nucleotide sugar dehydrogenase [Marinobacter sp. LV10R520-4]PFG53746.1 nucleotide sugar dehydrogenase [Marinobacter sp. LV10R520-4]
MKRRVIGFDINTTRVQQLRDGVDVTQEVSLEELAEVSQLSFTTELEGLCECSVFIITVPTPIDEFKAPDLTPLIKASKTVGQVLKAGDIVIGDGFQIRPRFASSIRVAEAAKVIENTQRDVNIALMNELAMIFRRMNIDTHEVLAAAGTKWNFLPFKPGLVGGHCIGVDPYYLTHKAQAIGYHPEIILAGRRVNDGMGPHVAAELVKKMIKAGHTVAHARVLVLGFTFKENCPDLRNTRVIDVVRELKEFGCSVDVSDPWVSSEETEREYGVALTEAASNGDYDALILAVPHREYLGMTTGDFRAYLKQGGVLFDLKGVLPLGAADLRL